MSIQSKCQMICLSIVPHWSLLVQKIRINKVTHHSFYLRDGFLSLRSDFQMCAPVTMQIWQLAALALSTMTFMNSVLENCCVPAVTVTCNELLVCCKPWRSAGVWPQRSPGVPFLFLWICALVHCKSSHPGGTSRHVNVNSTSVTSGVVVGWLATLQNGVWLVELQMEPVAKKLGWHERELILSWELYISHQSSWIGIGSIFRALYQSSVLLSRNRLSFQTGNFPGIA